MPNPTESLLPIRNRRSSHDNVAVRGLNRRPLAHWPFSQPFPFGWSWPSFAMPRRNVPGIGVPWCRRKAFQIVGNARDVGPMHKGKNGEILDQDVVHLDEQLPPLVRVDFRDR